MKKVNFKNQYNGDDKGLIELLKKIEPEVPSDQFVEVALKKFFAEKSRTIHVHKPLRLPLLLMVVIGLLPVIPLIMTTLGEVSFPTVDSPFYDFKYFSNQLNSWHLTYPLFIIIALLSLIQIELRAIKYNLTP